MLFVATNVESGTVGTPSELSGALRTCRQLSFEERLGIEVIGTPLGIAPNATCCIITARMRRFVTGWALVDVPERKHVMPRERHRFATSFDQ